MNLLFSFHVQKNAKKGQRMHTRFPVPCAPASFNTFVKRKKTVLQEHGFQRASFSDFSQKEDALELTKKETAAKVPFDASRVLNYFQDRAEQISSSRIAKYSLAF